MLPVSINRNIFALLLTTLLLGGCSMGSMTSWIKSDSKDESYVGKPKEAKPAAPAAVVRRYDSALATMQAGNDTQAQQQFEDFIKSYPEYPGAYLNLAILQSRQGETEQAMATLKRVVFQDPGYAPAHNQMGILYREQGEFNAAADAYQAAIDADPQYALAYLNMGVLNDLYRQDQRVALDYYEQYRLLQGPEADDPEVNRWISDLKRRVGAAQNTLPNSTTSLDPVRPAQ